MVSDHAAGLGAQHRTVLLDLSFQDLGAVERLACQQQALQRGGIVQSVALQDLPATASDRPR